jgi:hypothetical protein
LDFAIRNRDFLTKYHYHKDTNRERFETNMRRLVSEDIEAGRYPGVTTRREKNRKLRDMDSYDMRFNKKLRFTPIRWVYMFIYYMTTSMIEPYEDGLICTDDSHTLTANPEFEFTGHNKLGPPIVRIEPFKTAEQYAAVAKFRRRFIRVALIGDKAVPLSVRRGMHTKGEWDKTMRFVERNADVIRDMWTGKTEMDTTGFRDLELNELRYRKSIGVLAPDADKYLSYKCSESTRHMRKMSRYGYLLCLEDLKEKQDRRWDIPWRIKKYTGYHKEWKSAMYWD